MYQITLNNTSRAFNCYFSSFYFILFNVGEYLKTKNKNNNILLVCVVKNYVINKLEYLNFQFYFF